MIVPFVASLTLRKEPSVAGLAIPNCDQAESIQSVIKLSLLTLSSVVGLSLVKFPSVARPIMLILVMLILVTLPSLLVVLNCPPTACNCRQTTV